MTWQDSDNNDDDKRWWSDNSNNGETTVTMIRQQQLWWRWWKWIGMTWKTTVILHDMDQTTEALIQHDEISTRWTGSGRPRLGVTWIRRSEPRFSKTRSIPRRNREEESTAAMDGDAREETMRHYCAGRRDHNNDKYWIFGEATIKTYDARQ